MPPDNVAGNSLPEKSVSNLGVMESKAEVSQSLMERLSGKSGESDDGAQIMWGEQSDGFEAERAEAARSQALRLVADADSRARADAIRRTEPDLAKRARKLASNNLIDFKDIKVVRLGESFVNQTLPTAQNKWAVIDALFGTEEHAPRFDHFRGRVVDHEGRKIDKAYPVVNWVDAFAAAGLKGMEPEDTRAIIKEWAINHECNDLIRRLEKMIPEWDKKPRARRMLIDLFQCNDTDLNKDFGEYFWLSLYNRAMNPGCDASIVLCLFGAQHSGKSFFQKRLCRLLTGDEGSDTVRLNFDLTDMGVKDFLRKITGTSVIASGSEMTGLGRGDLSKIKDFVSRTNDPMDFKYDGHIDQQRQWIIIVDSNDYSGIQRDKTGNRRFYPMFVGQTDDRDGQPQWLSEGFNVGPQIASPDFEKDFWQIMAECRNWIAENGQEGYQRLLDEVASKVTKFNQYEMDNMRGTSRNSPLEQNFMPVLRALLDCTDRKAYPLKFTRYYEGDAYPHGVMVSTALFGELYRTHAEAKGVTFDHLSPMARMYGAREVTGKGKNKFFIFTQFKSIQEMVDSMDHDDGLDRIEVRRSSGASDGF